MKKHNILLLKSIFLLLIITIITSCNNEDSESSLDMNVNEEASDVAHADKDYNFQFEIPNDSWEILTRWNVQTTNSNTIIKRISVINQESEIVIDVFNKQESSLEDWVKYYLGKSSKSTYFKINNRAMMFEENYEGVFPTISVVFNDENNNYVIHYTLKDSGVSLDRYKELLLSFKASNKYIFNTREGIPNEIDNWLSKVSVSEKMVNNCCGVSDPGNVFPCSNGNCTWWVYYKKSYVPFRGNANVWGTDVRAGRYPGWYLDNYNYSNGDIAWVDANNANDNFGHVAYIEGGNNNYTLSISEMTWEGSPCADEPRTRNRNKSNYDGFIRKTNQPH